MKSNDIMMSTMVGLPPKVHYDYDYTGGTQTTLPSVLMISLKEYRICF